MHRKTVLAFALMISLAVPSLASGIGSPFASTQHRDFLTHLLKALTHVLHLATASSGCIADPNGGCSLQ
jgi:hypothetical protein